MPKTPQQIEQEQYELRIINKDLQREQEVERLKKKHLISGTIKEQKQLVRAKRLELDDPDIEDIEEIVVPVVEPEVIVEPVIEPEVIVEENANNLLDPQPTEESTP